MKYKKILKYKVLKFLFNNYSKFFQSLYKHKLNANILDLIKKDIEINVIYDVGAHKGDFSNFLNRTSLKQKDFYLFEANENNEKYLSQLNYKYFIEVLSDKKKELSFFSRSLGSDSYFQENTNIYDNSNVNIKTSNTLDNLVNQNNLPSPDFLKIDTQGSEIDILRGAKKTIVNCKLIYLECPIIDFNAGSPNFYQYIKYLESLNFVPYDICEVHHINKVLVQIDILFIEKLLLNSIYPGKKKLNILS
jgi:FkbM family methyltransferase